PARRKQLFDAIDKVRRIGEAIKPHPVAVPAIANKDRTGMAREIGRVGTETGQDPVHLWFFSSKPEPARGAAEVRGILLQAFRRIGRRVDGQRDEFHIAPELLAQFLDKTLLNLAENHRGHRANGRAARVDETDDHNAVADRLALEAYGLAIHIDELVI